MNTYEKLLVKADNIGIIIKEKPLQGSDGRIKENRIAIRKDINTSIEKGCVTAEEIGHFCTTVGNIFDQTIIENRKQELKARLFAYQQLVTPEKLIEAKRAGCRNLFEIADCLEVTEQFLVSAINAYRRIYGCAQQFDNYLLVFEPTFNIYKI